MSNKVAPAHDAESQSEPASTGFRAAGRRVMPINSLGAGQVATQNKMGRFLLEEEEARMALVALALQLGLGAASPSDSAAHYQVQSMRLDACACAPVRALMMYGAVLVMLADRSRPCTGLILSRLCWQMLAPAPAPLAAMLADTRPHSPCTCS